MVLYFIIYTIINVTLFYLWQPTSKEGSANKTQLTHLSSSFDNFS